MLEGEGVGPKHLSRSKLGSSEAESLVCVIVVPLVFKMEFVEVFKMSGCVDLHIDARPGGLEGRERDPTDLSWRKKSDGDSIF